MKKWLVLLLSLALLLPLAASAQEVVNVYNWEDYIDEAVLDQFEEETGIHVNYMRFTTNEDMMVSVRANPGAYDVIFPSEYCVERLIAEDLLAEINYDNVPNMSYTLESLLNPDYDPNNAHSVPYMWGTVGILYNTTMVSEPVDSWGILWDTDYMNNVFMLDSIRDTMGVFTTDDNGQFSATLKKGPQETKVVIDGQESTVMYVDNIAGMLDTTLTMK